MTTYIRLASLLLLLALLASSPLYAQAPHLINFQAQLADGGSLPSSLNATFSIFDRSTGGSALWSEQQTVQQTNGAFSVLLGSATAFPANLFTTSGERYLEVTVNGQPAGARLRLSSTAYAMRAETADQTGPGGLTFPDGTVQTTAATGGGSSSPWTGTGNDIFFNTGSVGIGETTPEGLLDIQDAFKFQTHNVGAGNQSMRLFFDEGVTSGPNTGNWGFSLIHAGDNDDQHIFNGTPFSLPRNTFYFLNHENNPQGEVALSIKRGNGNVGIGTANPVTRLALNAGLNGSDVGITQGQVGGGNTMEFTTDDGTGNQATRFLMRGFSPTANIEFYSGARGQETQTLLIEGATGNVGIGTASPSGRLHVQRAVDLGANIANHVALFENTASTNNSGPDVLALKTSATSPAGNANFITFFNGNNAAIGSIEGIPAGTGITFKSGSGDFAEMLPPRFADEPLAVGDVVGIFGGHITKTTSGADQVLVVSSQPIVLGNAPHDDDNTGGSLPVAFLGQIPTNVRGPVRIGDYIVPSGHSDGIARAISPAAMQVSDHRQVIGRAWEASSEAGLKQVMVSVGLDRVGALVDVVQQQQHELEALRSQMAELHALVERLAAEQPEDRASDEQALSQK